MSFAVIGDTPYEDEDELALVEHLAALNELGGASFLVHVGDIKRGAPPCVESEYTDIRGWLLELVAPVFIIPGDNEWNDCDDPDEAWAFWWQHLQALDESWPDAPAAARQPERLENFAFVERGVLFVGINLVGGAVHDIAEWQTRLAQDADWVEGQLAAHAGELYAVVVFGHANPSSAHAGFTTPFAEIVASAGLPTLFVHGDGHEWLNTPGYLGVEALRRVQVECCSAKPLLVTVDPEAAEPFTLERDPF
ncbi:MAG: metallophosphoesterase [Planctomycetota bacterium]